MRFFFLYYLTFDPKSDLKERHEFDPDFGKHASQDLFTHLSSVRTVELLHKPKHFHELEPYMKDSTSSDFH